MSADFTDASGITHTLEELICAALYDKEAPLADRRRIYNSIDEALADFDRALDREQEEGDRDAQREEAEHERHLQQLSSQ